MTDITNAFHEWRFFVDSFDFCLDIFSDTRYGNIAYDVDGVLAVKRNLLQLVVGSSNKIAEANDHRCPFITLQYGNIDVTLTSRKISCLYCPLEKLGSWKRVDIGSEFPNLGSLKFVDFFHWGEDIRRSTQSIECLAFSDAQDLLGIMVVECLYVQALTIISDAPSGMSNHIHKPGNQ